MNRRMTKCPCFNCLAISRYSAVAVNSCWSDCNLWVCCMQSCPAKDSRHCLKLIDAPQSFCLPHQIDSKRDKGGGEVEESRRIAFVPVPLPDKDSKSAPCWHVTGVRLEKLQFSPGAAWHSLISTTCQPSIERVLTTAYSSFPYTGYYVVYFARAI